VILWISAAPILVVILDNKNGGSRRGYTLVQEEEPFIIYLLISTR